MRHLQEKQHLVYGTYTLKGGKLTYRTQGVEHAHAAQQTRDAKRDFTVTALKPEDKDFTGRVESVDLVVGVNPVTWEIVMRTKPV